MNTDRAEEVIDLFYQTFKTSENEREAKMVSDLVKRYLVHFPRADLKGFIQLKDNEIIACVFFSQLSFPGCSKIVFLLSPMAVKTEFQGTGVGQALIRYAHKELRGEGVNITMTYGDERFYSKVGYMQVDESDIEAPLPLTYPDGWLANQLDGSSPLKIKGPSKCIRELNDKRLW